MLRLRRFPGAVMRVSKLIASVSTFSGNTFRSTPTHRPSRARTVKLNRFPVPPLMSVKREPSFKPNGSDGKVCVTLGGSKGPLGSPVVQPATASAEATKIV